MSVRLHFHGAAGCVTGACFRLVTDEAEVLVDCGLFQGSKTLKALNYDPFPFEPRRISALLLTHAHIDHSGQIPRLIRNGFRGPVYATAGTRDLCSVMLPDAGGIQEHEVEFLNRRNQQRGHPLVEPIYTRRDAERCLRNFEVVDFGDWREVAPGLRARWWNAGHILGSASVEVEIVRAGEEPLRLLFSGDLGPGGREFAPDPEGPGGVDHVIMESTYGAVERPPVDPATRRRLLAEVVRDAHRAGGPLVMPAFAVERTQELLIDLLQVMSDGAAPAGPIFIDSPLALKATEVFLRHGVDRHGENPFRNLRGHELLRPTPRVDQSRAIERLSGWHVIMAGSGMCDAGRIRHHLKRLLWRREATVLLTGFQAVGTLGRLLEEGRRFVRIQGDSLKVRATVRSLDIYSGHADAAALESWLRARLPVSGSVFLTHGEPASLDALRKRLTVAGLDLALAVPEIDQTVRLRRRRSEALPAQAAPRILPGAAAQLDWHNARAELLSELEATLARLPDDAARVRLLDRLARDVAAGRP
ncbi:MAG: MBL fold metallo-hydrolase [Caulobacteraceae bacterium]|nr:MBL fold metallo-hydrolase [Caulobacteraceae bacterium]